MPSPAPSTGRIVAVGGGSGLAVALRGLKHHVGREIVDLKAVVTMADDGGSSGRLRRELGVLPPGDVRNCLVALADDEDQLARLFQYRFANGGGLSGHSFGNLFLTALTGITGDFYQAILTAESVLSVRGKIYPATLNDVRLLARGVSGALYTGESAVGLSGEMLESVSLEPSNVAAFTPAAEALQRADLILLGPGSLYTSILPNLLIAGIRRAIEESRAPVVLVTNLMTQPGETDGMDAVAHLEAIERHVGSRLVDRMLVNTSPLPPAVVSNYGDTGAIPVRVDAAEIRRRGVELVGADLLAPGELIRHDPASLAAALVALMVERRTPSAATTDVAEGEQP